MVFIEIKKKILVIDDNKDICTAIKGYLSNYNYNVNTVQNYQEALNKLNNEFDLIILDIMMPGMDDLKYSILKII